MKFYDRPRLFSLQRSCQRSEVRNNYGNFVKRYKLIFAGGTPIILLLPPQSHSNYTSYTPNSVCAIEGTLQL